MSKLDIANEMRAFDRKDRRYMKEMSEEEAKKFAPYVLMRWGASVEGPTELQEYYLRATNERVNVGLWDFNGTTHKQLQWLLCTTVSPGMGNHRHYWVSTKKAEKSNTAGVKILKQIYPHLDDEEITVLAAINTLKEIKELARAHGINE